MEQNKNQTPAQKDDETRTYSGSPEEVGTKLFLDAIGPTIHSATKNGDVTTQQVARMMAGILAGYAGMMCDNFSPQAAIEILRGTADRIEKAVAAGEFAGSGHPH